MGDILSGEQILTLKPSYFIRLTSNYIALQTIINNPLGVGWGGSNSIFKNNMQKSPVKVKMIGDNIDYHEMIDGTQEITPKSFVLEVVVSLGVVGILFFIYLFYILLIYSKNKYITLSFIGLFIMGLMAESSPFMALFIILYVLVEKDNDIKKTT